MKQKITPTTRQKMKLILGSCLALQFVTISHADAEIAKTSSYDISSTNLRRASQYHAQQMQELLGLSSFEVTTKPSNPAHLALYIHKKVKQLLPEPWRPKSARIAQALIDTAGAYKMDPLFLMAVIQQESRFHPTVVGSAGEIGLMQIKPTTAKSLIGHNHMSTAEISRTLRDPVANIRLGAAHLAQLRKAFHGRGAVFISAYNQGATSARNHLKQGKRPRIYSDKVLAAYLQFTSGLAREGKQANRRIASLHRPLVQN